MDNPILLLLIIAGALVTTLALQDTAHVKTIIKRVIKKVVKTVFYAIGLLAYIFIYLPSFYLSKTKK